MSHEVTGLRKEIVKILGSCNCIVIIPDGFPYGGKHNPLTDFALGFSESLEAYALFNCKYKKNITDLSNSSNIKKSHRITREFLTPLHAFKEEIRGNNQTPLIIILQMGEQTDQQGSEQVDILIGSGQGERSSPDRPHRPTFPPSLLNRLRVAISDAEFSSELAPVESSLCGREENSLNQLFHRKNFIEDMYDPTTQSLLLTLSPNCPAKADSSPEKQGRKLATAFAHLADRMPLVRQVRLASIEAASQNDKKYIFRVNNVDDGSHSLLREAYIEELAQSINQSGLLHPLVLLQKDDGNYKILCGFRRYQALTRLGREWTEAKIYKESDFSREEFFNISLAENTRRRNLNPVEVGNFLESAARELGLNNAHLAEKFGQTLGIGKPNAQVSQSTVHKYRKVNGIRSRRESPEIINDIINEELQFTIAAEILAPIREAKDRNRFYLDVIKPLKATRPQIIQFKKLLEERGPSLAKTINSQEVQEGIENALATSHPATSFLQMLQRGKRASPQDRAKKKLQEKANRFQKLLVGEKMKKTDLKLTPSRAKSKEEITLQLKIRQDNLEEAIQVLTNLQAHQKELAALFKDG